MKKYIAPEIKRVNVVPKDIISASPLWNYLNENGYEGNIRSFDFEDVAPEEGGE